MGIGTILFSYALTMSPYKNEELFRNRYMSMTAGQSVEYWNLRQEMLTPKYNLEDYGLTLLLLSLVVYFLIRKNNWQFELIIQAKYFLLLAFLLPFTITGGFMFDMVQQVQREEVPHWADSLGIPLMAVPGIFISTLLFSFIHLVYLIRVPFYSKVLNVLSAIAQLWLWLLVTLFLIFLCLSLVMGAYWYAIPAVLWAYFYYSLMKKAT